VDGIALMRLAISVSFDPAKGYVITHRELGTVTALSLSGLRKQLATRMGPEIGLRLDRSARLERDARRHGSASRAQVAG
jgi:hypothetical protein